MIEPKELIKISTLNKLPRNLLKIANLYEKKIDNDIMDAFVMNIMDNDYYMPSKLVLNTDEEYVDYGNELKESDKIRIKIYIVNLYRNKGWLVYDIGKTDGDIRLNFDVDKAILRDDIINEIIEEK